MNYDLWLGIAIGLFFGVAFLCSEMKESLMQFYMRKVKEEYKIKEQTDAAKD